ncbi:MAG: type II toxin-antitoxin system HicA family toxin [Patescibacteria group bacterium]
MAGIDKLKSKFKNNPASLKYKDIERILIYLEFEKIPTKRSYFKFKHNKLKIDLVIPVHNNECKEFYKKEINKIIKKIK